MQSRKKINVGAMLRAYELVCEKGKTQESALKCMLKEGTVGDCTRTTVSRWCKMVGGVADHLRGMKYEAYVKEHLKDAEEKDIFDKCKIKHVYPLGGIKKTTYPDLLVLYDNNDVDVVSCKCFKKPNYRVRIMTNSACDISPELNAFMRLRSGKKFKLPNNSVLKCSRDNKVRLIILLNSVKGKKSKEYYKIYEKAEELPKTLYFSEKALREGILKSITW